MLSRLQPVLEHLAAYQAVPGRTLLELLRGPWNRPDDTLQVLLDHHLIRRAQGKSDAYILGPKGRKLLGYKRLDYEPSPDAVRLGVLKQHVVELLSHGNWQLDEGDRRVDQGDLAFRLPGGERAYLRCTLKDISVGELRLMLDRYVHNSRIATETVIITARRPEKYRSYLEGEFISAVRLVPPAIYNCLDA